MTTKRTNQQVGMLKAAILTGSLVATFAGTYLLGLQEPVETAANRASVQPPALVIPADNEEASQLPPQARGVRMVKLKPIPQVVQPQIRPVTRTRSSR
jgi:hypothetical protein